MSKEPIAALTLQPSETAVLAAASRFYAAYIAAGQVTQDTEASTMEYCVHSAIKMALRVDRLLQSDDESVGLGRRDSAA
jgi:hypothetical protein